MSMQLSVFTGKSGNRLKGKWGPKDEASVVSLTLVNKDINKHRYIWCACLEIEDIAKVLLL